MSKTNWISVKDRLPKNGQRVLAKYVGVYGPAVVTFWRGRDKFPHFGMPHSHPATHWCPLPR
jgi:hypothetical protein